MWGEKGFVSINMGCLCLCLGRRLVCSIEGHPPLGANPVANGAGELSSGQC